MQLCPFCTGWKHAADISVPDLLEVFMTDWWKACFCVACGQKINRVLLGLSPEHSVVRVQGSSGPGLAVRDGAQCPCRGICCRASPQQCGARGWFGAMSRAGRISSIRPGCCPRGSRVLIKLYQAERTRKHRFVAMATWETRAVWSILKESPYYQEFEGKVLSNAGGLAR